MSRKVFHLKDELRRTFTMYALIPTFVIATFVLVLAFAYWHTNVLERNQSKLTMTGNSLTTIISSYLNQANEAAALCDMDALRGDKTARTGMYESMYHYIHNIGIQTEFYVFDAQLNRLISNQAHDPEFIQLAQSADWGIIGQIKQTPAVPVFAFVSPVQEYAAPKDLVVGKAVLEKGRITGYVLFVLPQKQLLNRVTTANVQFVIKDKYDYAPIYTDDYFVDTLNKMKPEFIQAEGYFSYADRKYYSSKQDILNGELTVYALTPVGGIVSQLTNTLMILAGVLVILSLSIVVSVKKQVEQKTQMIDQLVEAFAAVKQGNLDMHLTIDTHNEFQIIGDAYNLMLASLKELMETNHEKARATVISEIKQLESQFNPHFLFNTLENIKFMIKLDPAAAGKMIVALSTLLRYSIDNTHSEVTIQEDMAYTHNYLDIQKYRFGQRLNYILQLPPELNDCVVPKLIVQPIIENAIKYGFRDCQHLLVEIEISIAVQQLVIRITNNGMALDEQALDEIRAMLAATTNCSQHSGLYNVQRRIHLLYGEPFGLTIASKPQGGTAVTIMLPVRRKAC